MDDLKPFKMNSLTPFMLIRDLEDLSESLYIILMRDTGKKTSLGKDADEIVEMAEMTIQAVIRDLQSENCVLDFKEDENGNYRSCEITMEYDGVREMVIVKPDRHGGSIRVIGVV